MIHWYLKKFLDSTYKTFQKQIFYWNSKTSNNYKVICNRDVNVRKRPNNGHLCQTLRITRYRSSTIRNLREAWNADAKSQKRKTYLPSCGTDMYVSQSTRNCPTCTAPRATTLFVRNSIVCGPVRFSVIGNCCSLSSTQCKLLYCRMHLTNILESQNVSR